MLLMVYFLYLKCDGVIWSGEWVEMFDVCGDGVDSVVFVECCKDDCYYFRFIVLLEDVGDMIDLKVFICDFVK